MRPWDHLLEELRSVAGEFEECRRLVFDRADEIFARSAVDRPSPATPVRIRGVDVLSLDGLKEWLIAGGRAREETEKIFGQSRRERVIIERLLEGSNAGISGVEIGDDIVEYDRHPIRDIEHLSYYILESAGRNGRVPMTLIRGGVEHRLEVGPGPLGVVISTRRSIPVER